MTQPAIPVDRQESEQTSPTMLFELLNEEIATIEAQLHRPRWTPWAIGTVLVSLTWLFLSIVEKGIASWPNVLLAFLALSLVVDVFFYLSLNLAFSAHIGQSEDRFSYLDDTLGYARPYLSTLLLRSSALLIASYYIPPVVPGWLLTTTRIYIYSFVVLLLFVGLLSILHLPFPRNLERNPWWVNLITFLLWQGTGIVAAAGLAWIFLTRQATAAVGEWRVALILGGFFLLIALLCKRQQRVAALPELQDLRRRICLGRTDINHARQELDILIHGMTLGDVLQPQVSKVLKSFSEEQRILDSITSDL